MDLHELMKISYYKTVAPIDEAHNVYLVRHTETGRFYVKKTLRFYSAEIYRDLKEHPIAGIPAIIECAEDDGQLIVIEEYVSGRSLFAKIEASGQGADNADGGDILTVEKIGYYMVRLCEILERLHAHEPPIVHRDLKPSNIILTPNDEVVLIDFNASKYYSGEAGRGADTELIGTKGYAAPEQYGFRESSPRTDIYAVGRILQECVKALPYEDHTFDRVIEKCVQMEPSSRYASAGALRAAIMRCLGQNDRPDITGPTVNPYLPPGFRTLNPWKMVIAAFVYFAVFDLCLTLKIQGMDESVLPAVRAGTLVIALVNILIGTNYLGCQRLFPFLRRRKGEPKRTPWLQTAGVILAMVIATLLLFAGMVFCLQAVYGSELTGFESEGQSP